MSTLAHDVPQVVIGDQLTRKNIRGCKLWRQSELCVNDHLSWACEVPGKYPVYMLVS